jgi:hypothetical protein
MGAMVNDSRILTLAEMESIAKGATRAALMGYRQPANYEHLTLGSELTDAKAIFELYIADERPQDAKVISRASVDRLTGNVEVEIFLEPL